MSQVRRFVAACAIAWIVLFSLYWRVLEDWWPGAVPNGFKILFVLALAPALLAALGDAAYTGPRPGRKDGARRCARQPKWAMRRRTLAVKVAHMRTCAPAESPACAPGAHTYFDKRHGTYAERQGDGADTLWVKLAPNPDAVARDAQSGRAIGTRRSGAMAIKHDVRDGPERSWLPASWNMIRPFRNRNLPWYGSSVGVRYGDIRDGTGLFG